MSASGSKKSNFTREELTKLLELPRAWRELYFLLNTGHATLTRKMKEWGLTKPRLKIIRPKWDA